jgi:hypothetical protein
MSSGVAGDELTVRAAIYHGAPDPIILPRRVFSLLAQTQMPCSVNGSLAYGMISPIGPEMFPRV